MASENLVAGDPVWAKMKGYPPWPAKVVDPPSTSKLLKNKKCYVLFFGTGDYAWIPIENVILHGENMLTEARSRKKPAATFKDAIDAIVSYCKTYKKEKQPKVIKKTISTDNGIKSLQVDNAKMLKSVKKYDRKQLKKSVPEKAKNEKPVSESLAVKDEKPFKKLAVVTAKNKDLFKKPLPVKQKKLKKTVRIKVENEEPLKKSVPDKAETGNKRPVRFVAGKSSESKFIKLENSSSPQRFSPIKDVYNPYSIYQQSKPVYNSLNYVEPSPKRVGFIGLGMMGKAIVKNLLQSGHIITVWNINSFQCNTFVDMGAKKACFPSDVILTCDMTFCCVSDPEASLSVMHGENGVLHGLHQAQKLGLPRKGYVELTSIDDITSKKINEAVSKNNGVYLEAALCGSSKDAEEGHLLILAAGDEELFQACESCFHAIGGKVFFMSENIGDAVKMRLTLSTISGVACAALAEAMVMTEKMKLNKSHFLECVRNGPLACEFLLDKAQRMIDLSFQKETSLKHVQQDIALTVSIGNSVSQPTPIAAVAKEIYKLGRLRNFSHQDMSAVYKVVKY